jgi:hypothetical protein
MKTMLKEAAMACFKVLLSIFYGELKKKMKSSAYLRIMIQIQDLPIRNLRLLCGQIRLRNSFAAFSNVLKNFYQGENHGFKLATVLVRRKRKIVLYHLFQLLIGF